MYNYLENVIDDVKEAIAEYNTKEFCNREEFEERLNDELWISDSVTGNASGSYYCNAYKAEEALCHNWDLLSEALAEFCCEENPIEKGAEWCDVTIRCYLLSQAIAEALDDMEDNLTFSDEE